MDEYAKELQKVKTLDTYKLDPKEVAKEEDLLRKGKMTVEEFTHGAGPKKPTSLTSELRLAMSSILGQLNWMARQGRYDIAYGVSHVQQLMTREPTEAVEFLNKVVYRARQPMVQKIKKLKDWENLVVISASDAAYGA